MGDVVQFAEARTKLGFERIKSTYSVREIRRQFGLSERYIRRWTREGWLPTATGLRDGEICFDLRALTIFRRVRDQRSQGRSIRQIEAELYGQLNLFPEPEGQLIELPIKFSPFEEALQLHEKGDSKAADFYLRAAMEDDHAPDAFCNLGILEFEAGKTISAFDRFTQALRIDPRHFEAHFNLAHLYFEAGDLRLAKLHYEIAAEIEPSFADLYFNLGLVHAITGELQSAAQALHHAKKLVPEEEGKKVEDLLRTVEGALRASTLPSEE
jgi:tetratricopeptide (TPR) repeat protein